MCRSYSYTLRCVHKLYRTCRKNTFFSFLFVEMSGRTHHQHTDILLYDSLAHKQTWSWMWKRTLKQNQNKKQQCSHTSPQQDVLSKQTLFVSLWSVPQFTLVELQNWVARTGFSADAGQMTEKTHVKHKTTNTKRTGPHTATGIVTSRTGRGNRGILVVTHRFNLCSVSNDQCEAKINTVGFSFWESGYLMLNN